MGGSGGGSFQSDRSPDELRAEVERSLQGLVGEHEIPGDVMNDARASCCSKLDCGDTRTSDTVLIPRKAPSSSTATDARGEKDPNVVRVHHHIS